MGETTAIFATYGWALLALMVIIAVFAYFGLFSFKNYTMDIIPQEAKNKFCIENNGIPTIDDITKDCTIKEGNFTTRYVIKNISGNLTFLK